MFYRSTICLCATVIVTTLTMATSGAQDADNAPDSARALRDAAALLRAQGRAEVAEAVDQLRAELLGVRREVDRGADWDKKLKIDFKNRTEATEGKKILTTTVGQDPSLLINAEGVELVHAFDFASKPMQRNSGKPTETDGSYAEKALVGSSGFIMSYGPYVELDPGRYIVAYRFKFLDEIRGDRVCFLDVCHNAVTYSGKRPGSMDAPGKLWNEIAIPLDVPNKMKFEFRMWPQNNRVALDRIYVYRLSDRKDPASLPLFSVMGAVKRPGFRVAPEEGATVEALIKTAGGVNSLAHKTNFSVWRRDGETVTPLVIKPGSGREKVKVLPGDIIWIPER